MLISFEFLKNSSGVINEILFIKVIDDAEKELELVM
jgi:hypothetical protein